jgi:hypothetical protein
MTFSRELRKVRHFVDNSDHQLASLKSSASRFSPDYFFVQRWKLPAMTCEHLTNGEIDAIWLRLLSSGSRNALFDTGDVR